MLQIRETSSRLVRRWAANSFWFSGKISWPPSSLEISSFGVFQPKSSSFCWVSWFHNMDGWYINKGRSCSMLFWTQTEGFPHFLNMMIVDVLGNDHLLLFFIIILFSFILNVYYFTSILVLNAFKSFNFCQIVCFYLFCFVRHFELNSLSKICYTDKVY